MHEDEQDRQVPLLGAVDSRIAPSKGSVPRDRPPSQTVPSAPVDPPTRGGLWPQMQALLFTFLPLHPYSEISQ